MQITGESLLSAVLAINKDIKIRDHAYIKLHFQELRIVWNQKEVFSTDIPDYDMTFTPKTPLQATQNDG